MIDPEPAYILIGAGQSESAFGFGVREEGAVKIHPDAVCLGPVDPRGEMLGFQFISLDLAASLGVAGVHIQPVFARQEAHDFVHVRPQFVGGARFAGIRSGRHYAAPGQTIVAIETSDVVALPAVQ